jgi:hypothetical protein
MMAFGVNGRIQDVACQVSISLCMYPLADSPVRTTDWAVQILSNAGTSMESTQYSEFLLLECCTMESAWNTTYSEYIGRFWYLYQVRIQVISTTTCRSRVELYSLDYCIDQILEWCTCTGDRANKVTNHISAILG